MGQRKGGWELPISPDSCLAAGIDALMELYLATAALYMRDCLAAIAHLFSSLNLMCGGWECIATTCILILSVHVMIPLVCVLT